MKPAGLRGWSPITGIAGSILIEVVVAAVLVGLIVASLGTAFAGTVQRARTARNVASSESGAAGFDAHGAWEWGPRVVAAWWSPGPVLHIRVSDAADGSGADSHVGLWADGWLVEETLVPGDDAGGAAVAGELQVPDQTWRDLADQELVIRVRVADGAWGPPWRMAVAGLTGGDPALGSPMGAQPASPTVVAHRPGAGTSSLVGSWSAAAMASPPFGVLFILNPAAFGWGGATLDGRSQWWWMEDGRSVDLYF